MHRPRCDLHGAKRAQPIHALDVPRHVFFKIWLTCLRRELVDDQLPLRVLEASDADLADYSAAEFSASLRHDPGRVEQAENHHREKQQTWTSSLQIDPRRVSADQCYSAPAEVWFII